MNLSVLEDRILSLVPEEYHGSIREEFGKFEVEIARMSEEEGSVGQASLNPFEISNLKTTNQHGGEGLTVVQWQIVKAYAIENGVTNWTEKVDGSLSTNENISLVQEHGGDNSTLRKTARRFR